MDIDLSSLAVAAARAGIPRDNVSLLVLRQQIEAERQIADLVSEAVDGASTGSLGTVVDVKA